MQKKHNNKHKLLIESQNKLLKQKYQRVPKNTQQTQQDTQQISEDTKQTPEDTQQISEEIAEQTPQIDWVQYSTMDFYDGSFPKIGVCAMLQHL